MVKSKRVGNIVYTFDGSEFTIMLLGSEDENKRVNLSSVRARHDELAISNVEFTQSLLEEARAVLQELSC